MFDRLDVATHRDALIAAADRHRLVRAAAGPVGRSAPTGAGARPTLVARARAGVGHSLIGMGQRLAGSQGSAGRRPADAACLPTA